MNLNLALFRIQQKTIFLIDKIKINQQITYFIDYF